MNDNWNAPGAQVGRWGVLNKIMHPQTSEKLSKDKVENLPDSVQAVSQDELVYLESIGEDWLNM